MGEQRTHENGRSERKGRSHGRVRVWHQLVLAGFVLLLGSSRGVAQALPAGDPLATTVAGLDATLFAAYNACDLTALENLVADDLEFFHDADGLAVGKQPFLDSTRKNICGKVRRDLVPGSLDVYRLGSYGALEVGVHRFHHPGAADDDAGEGKFVIVWRNNGGRWTMARTISYAHHAVSN
jgi:ketosteroid isomerase-like protein